MQQCGIVSTLIMYWPAGIANKMKRSTPHQVAHILDIMPTIVEITKSNYPSNYNSHSIPAMEGESFAALLNGSNSGPRKKPIFWEHENKAGMRDGDWKITKIFDQEWELYDLSNDRTEQHNLSKKYPERFKLMIEQWNVWAESVNVN